MKNINWKIDNNIVGCKIHKTSIDGIDVEIETSKEYQYDKHSGRTSAYNKHCLYVRYIGDYGIKNFYNPKNIEDMFFPLFTTLKQVKQKAILIVNEVLKEQEKSLNFIKIFSITILLTLFLSASAYAYPQPYPPRVYYSPDPYAYQAVPPSVVLGGIIRNSNADSRRLGDSISRLAEGYARRQHQQRQYYQR